MSYEKRMFEWKAAELRFWQDRARRICTGGGVKEKKSPEIGLPGLVNVRAVVYRHGVIRYGNNLVETDRFSKLQSEDVVQLLGLRFSSVADHGWGACGEP